MKKTVLLIIIGILVLPAAYAGYCEDFDEEQCLDNAARWFETDSCKSKIVCSPVYEDHSELGQGIGYMQCETKHKDNFSDCINDPTSFCYDGVAYDVTKSKACECGSGYSYMILDSCGNPTEWSEECIDISTCEVESINGANTHKNCQVTNCVSQDVMLQGGQSAEEFIIQMQSLMFTNIDEEQSNNLFDEQPITDIESYVEDTDENSDILPEIKGYDEETVEDDKDEGEQAVSPDKTSDNKEYSYSQLEKDFAVGNIVAKTDTRNSKLKEFSTSLLLFTAFIMVYSFYIIGRSSIRRHFK